jgi:hypothetical protein
VDWTVHSAVRRGNDSNRLGLSCVGTHITATVNGVNVASLEDEQLDSGVLAFSAGAVDANAPIEGWFDNLEVLTP